MTPKPIVNLAELAMKSTARGSRFANRAGRIGGLIGMEQLGAQYMTPPMQRRLLVLF